LAYHLDSENHVKSTEGRYLKYKADRRSIAFLLICYALVAVGFVYQPQGATRVGLVAAACLFAFLCAVIAHNTVHVPIFKKKWMNRVFQVFHSFGYGHAISAYVPGHNLSHHQYTQSEKDILRTSKFRFRWNLLNQLFFTPRVAPAIIKAEMRYTKHARKRRPVWFKQMMTETLILRSAQLVLLLIDWQAFLLYVMIPHTYAAWGIIGINFVQHDGCDAASRYNHSRNIVGRWLNWWTFNNGYHGIHHMKSSLHWSLLPEAHAKELAPHVHPELDQKSLIAYCLRAFLFPGTRMTFDGKPVVLPELKPDEDWIGSDRLTPEISLGAVT
jgi:fatty acid desaturase